MNPVELKQKEIKRIDAELNKKRQQLGDILAEVEEAKIKATASIKGIEQGVEAAYLEFLEFHKKIKQ